MGTPTSAGLPALVAATAVPPERFYGPGGVGQLGGAPRAHRLYAPLNDPASAARLWTVSEELTGTRFA